MQPQNLEPIEIRHGLRKLAVVISISFLGFAVFFARILWHSNRSAALAFGGFWFIVFGASLAWTTSRFTQRLHIDDFGMRLEGFRPKRIAWEELRRVTVEKNDKDEFYKMSIQLAGGELIKFDDIDCSGAPAESMDRLINFLQTRHIGNEPQIKQIPNINMLWILIELIWVLIALLIGSDFFRRVF
ncbi:hypothetical protein LLG95_13110 [bacterium]|nr:hypothetical protein [bacterium]